jgi:serralysin
VYEDCSVADLNSQQEQEVTFLSGVTGQGTVAAASFWTWNDDDPATYSSVLSYEAKWGETRAGTGGSMTVAFNPASNWTPTEQAAFTAAMHLWSAETNVTFNIVGNMATADVQIARASDGKAEGGIGDLDTGDIGSSQLGHALDGSITIDTSKGGFGPIGSAFSVAGGYPWDTIIHELGHVIGLGHAGAYNSGTTSTSPQLTPYDNTAYSLMSYNDPPAFSSTFNWGASGGYYRSPVTPMMLDIAAADRIYGLPVGGPLSGGQTFGFNTNIQGDIAQFFDFTINTKPVITLFDTGLNNTLDVSGYSIGSTIDLHQGAFSNVAGLLGNVGIAFGTHIDTAIGGNAGDNMVGNEDGNVLMGGGSADTLTGGSGNDHIFGNLQSSTQGATDGGDVINAGDGLNYVNGNAGNDTITAGAGSNRLYGGQGNDTIHVTGNGDNHLNGNLGDDMLQVDAGSNDVHGGQGDDTILPAGGNNQSFGELGNDVIWGATGLDTMTGGADSDLFVLSGPTNSNPASWDEITDFTDGIDKLHVDASGSLPVVLHASTSFNDEASAAAYAQAVFGSATGEAAALQVGSDTYLFYTVGSGQDAVVKLDAVNAGTIDQSDFVTGTSHL